jgi:hypothetical protein
MQEIGGINFVICETDGELDRFLKFAVNFIIKEQRLQFENPYSKTNTRFKKKPVVIVVMIVTGLKQGETQEKKQVYRSV